MLAVSTSFWTSSVMLTLYCSSRLTEICFRDGMPSSTSIPLQNGRHEEEVDGGPVAVVALANALLDMFITVKDDSLVILKNQTPYILIRVFYWFSSSSIPPRLDQEVWPAL